MSVIMHKKTSYLELVKIGKTEEDLYIEFVVFVEI